MPRESISLLGLAKMHTFLELEALLTASHPGVDDRLAVRQDALEGVLRRDMFYEPPEQLARRAESLLARGREIGFLAAQESPGEHRVVAVGSKRTALERTMWEKWLKWEVPRDFEREYERAREEIQAELTVEKAKQKKLRDF